MSYSVGSIADLISGSNTSSKKTLKLKEIPQTPKPIVADNSSATDPSLKFKRPRKSSKPKFNPLEKPKNAPQKRKLNENESKKSPKKLKANQPKIINNKPKKQLTNKTFIERRINDKHSQESESRTVFVGNVPITADKDDLKKHFGVYGKIDNLWIRGVAPADLSLPKKVALIKRKLNSKRNSFQCYIRYATDEAATKALEANGTEYQGHHLRVDKLDSPVERDPKKAIFVGNLPFDAEDDHIWEIFQDCGEIISVRLVRDKASGMGKGFGYVNFESTDAVELALQMEDVMLGKRALRISRCTNVKVGDRGYKKRTPDGKKIRAKPRTDVPNQKPKLNKVEKPAEKEEKPAQFQGAKFTDKIKKKKINKVELKKKKISKLLTAAK